MTKKVAGVAVAAVLVFFAWKGADLSIPWPPNKAEDIVAPKPAPDLLALASPLKPILPKMMPSDRKYLANFYEAMAFVLLQDGERDQPIIGTTEQFVALHAGSLRLAIEKAKVGKYAGLGEAIDQTFLSAMGADQKKVDKDARGRLIAACGVLSWVFNIGHE